jgi:hypothetical protein
MVSWKRTLLVVGSKGAQSDNTIVSYEDGKTMLTTEIGGEELEIIIEPWLYPQIIEHMQHWNH